MPPGTWARRVGALLPHVTPVATSWGLLKLAAVHPPASTCVFPPGPAQLQNQILDGGLVAVLTAPCHHTSRSGKVSLQCTLISDHPGTPCLQDVTSMPSLTLHPCTPSGTELFTGPGSWQAPRSLPHPRAGTCCSFPLESPISTPSIPGHSALCVRTHIYTQIHTHR